MSDTYEHQMKPSIECYDLYSCSHWLIPYYPYTFCREYDLPETGYSIHYSGGFSALGARPLDPSMYQAFNITYDALQECSITLHKIDIRWIYRYLYIDNKKLNGYSQSIGVCKHPSPGTYVTSQRHDVLSTLWR